MSCERCERRYSAPLVADLLCGSQRFNHLIWRQMRCERRECPRPINLTLNLFGGCECVGDYLDFACFHQMSRERREGLHTKNFILNLLGSFECVGHLIRRKMGCERGERPRELPLIASHPGAREYF